MRYMVTSRHAEDVGLGSPLERGAEFEDSDVPDNMKDRLERLVAQGRVTEQDDQEQEGGEE
jgi:hypothetical protein